MKSCTTWPSTFLRSGISCRYILAWGKVQLTTSYMIFALRDQVTRHSRHWWSGATAPLTMRRTRNLPKLWEKLIDMIWLKNFALTRSVLDFHQLKAFCCPQDIFIWLYDFRTILYTHRTVSSESLLIFYPETLCSTVGIRCTLTRDL